MNGSRSNVLSGAQDLPAGRTILHGPFSTRLLRRTLLCRCHSPPSAFLRHGESFLLLRLDVIVVRHITFGTRAAPWGITLTQLVRGILRRLIQRRRICTQTPPRGASAVGREPEIQPRTADSILAGEPLISPATPAFQPACRPTRLSRTTHHGSVAGRPRRDSVILASN